MKLFYKPGACSLATHMILYELSAHFTIEKVDIKADKTESGLTFSSINPKRRVPVLQLESGELLTEGVAVLQYLADTHPSANLAPPCGTIERARLQEHLNFSSSQYHKAFGPLFSENATDAEKSSAIKQVEGILDYLNTMLADKDAYLLGEQFTVADAYLFVISNWTHFVGIDLSRWPKVAAYVERVSQRSATQKAMQAEGVAE